MGEKFEAVASATQGVVLMGGLAILLLAAFALYAFLGMVLIRWFVETGYGWLVAVTNIAQILGILLLLVGVIRRLRGIAGSGLLIAAFINGLTLVAGSGIVLYQNWGGWGLFAGVVMSVVDVVPVGLLSMALKGQWPIAFDFVILIAIVAFMWFAGHKYSESYTRRKLAES